MTTYPFITAVMKNDAKLKIWWSADLYVATFLWYGAAHLPEGRGKSLEESLANLEKVLMAEAGEDLKDQV